MIKFKIGDHVMVRYWDGIFEECSIEARHVIENAMKKKIAFFFGEKGTIDELTVDGYAVIVWDDMRFMPLMIPVNMLLPVVPDGFEEKKRMAAILGDIKGETARAKQKS